MSQSESESESRSESDAGSAPGTEPEAPVEDVVLRTSDLTKYFGAIEAVRNVSLDVEPDEILAIAGDNGAGKTTFIRMLSGVLQPTAGRGAPARTPQ